MKFRGGVGGGEGEGLPLLSFYLRTRRLRLKRLKKLHPVLCKGTHQRDTPEEGIAFSPHYS